MPEEGCLLHDSFGILDEVDDIVYLVTHRYLVFNLLQGILHAEVSLVYQTVGIYDMAQYTFAHLVFVLKQPGTLGRVRVKFALTLFICSHSPLKGR